ncbi:MAG: cyclic GMP-AMP synthase DncV-like nucleotidyltransferase [Aggregatilineales bacterium]
MYDLHSELYAFYDKHVRLSRDQQISLAKYRDTNIDRLNQGLDELAYERPARTCSQGSYAMITMVQHPENDYDIDTALIFDKDVLPDNPEKARERVLEAIKKGAGNFKYPPEARQNAVTVWYMEGHHIDLPVFRQYTDLMGSEIIEHAGQCWTRRDPSEITDWFKTEVDSKSPRKESGATVEDAQMRRIVQYLKMFTRSRSTWEMPGGLLISALVVECYRPDADRDDKALYDTMGGIVQRAQYNSEIRNPADCTQLLTDTTEHVNEVKQFGEKLTQAIEWLKPIFDIDSDKVAACKAWNDVFKHKYWTELIDGLELASKSKYVASTGHISTVKPSEPSVQSPTHRFYGDG